MEQNQQPQPPVFNQPQQQPTPQYQPRVAARPMMGFIQAVKTCLSKYINVKGRARRSEYWWYILFVVLVTLLASFLFPILLGWIGKGIDMNTFMVYMVLLILLTIVLMIPAYAAMTRRLHDSGRSGWWVAAQLLCTLVYSASYTIIMLPCLEKLSTVHDPMAMSAILTSAMQQSPVAATLMSVCGFGSFILGIITFIFTLLDSKWGTNKYGPSPKYQ